MSARRAPGHCCRRPNAFTLIELLVCVAVISTLISLLLPGLSGARRRAMLLKCMSNMRQISTAVQMYGHENEGYFPRTMETIASEVPVTVSWWAIENYQSALNPYIQMNRGGVNEDGQSTGKGNNVWFDPADPDANIPVMWGSFIDNGLVTGVPRKDSNIWKPAETIYATLREQNWSIATGVAIPDPLPVSDPNDPFWTSVYFDMCLDPWANTNDESDPFHWSAGRVCPPDSLFPAADHATPWDAVIDGRSRAQQSFPPRYGNGQPYAFCDGHVELTPFEATYESPEGNMWDIR